MLQRTLAAEHEAAQAFGRGDQHRLLRALDQEVRQRCGRFQREIEPDPGRLALGAQVYSPC